VVKPSKLYQRLLESRSSIPFRDFQRILGAFGFTLDRTKGSHRQYRHPQASRPLSIQPRGNMAKPYQVDQFLDIVEEFGLTIVE
jgi:HicA toxin of bacterial toxin-antitoxin,